jgi:hypothetical protein
MTKRKIKNLWEGWRSEFACVILEEPRTASKVKRFLQYLLSLVSASFFLGFEPNYEHYSYLCLPSFRSPSMAHCRFAQTRRFLPVNSALSCTHRSPPLYPTDLIACCTHLAQIFIRYSGYIGRPRIRLGTLVRLFFRFAGLFWMSLASLTLQPQCSFVPSHSFMLINGYNINPFFGQNHH